MFTYFRRPLTLFLAALSGVRPREIVWLLWLQPFWDEVLDCDMNSED